MVGSHDWRQIAFLGDPISELRLVLFTDADFAGDCSDMKSTYVGRLSRVGGHALAHSAWLHVKETDIYKP